MTYRNFKFPGAMTSSSPPLKLLKLRSLSKITRKNINILHVMVYAASKL